MTKEESKHFVDEMKKVRVQSQEPCEDAVSRKEVLKMIEQIQDAGGFIGYSTYSKAFDVIDNMPPVTPIACVATVKFNKDDLQELVDEKVEELRMQMGEKDE